MKINFQEYLNKNFELKINKEIKNGFPRPLLKYLRKMKVGRKIREILNLAGILTLTAAILALTVGLG